MHEMRGDPKAGEWPAQPMRRVGGEGKVPLTPNRQSTCRDVEHKKRGRPRIQPERGQPRAPGGQVVPLGPPPQLMGGVPGNRYDSFGPPRADHSASRRGSLPVVSSAHGTGIDQRQSHGPHSASSDVASLQSLRPMDSRWTSSPPPLLAFLNLELKILVARESFRATLADGDSLQDRALEDMVDPRHREAVRDLQTSLRQERTQRDPSALPPISFGVSRGGPEYQAVERLTERDVHNITHGSADRTDTWTFLLPNGRPETFRVRLRLGRTHLFFAVLELQPLSSASSQSSRYTGRPSPIDLSSTHYGAGHGPRESIYTHPGPPSPFGRSAPSPPFPSLSGHLITSLPPVAPSTMHSSGHGSGSPGRDGMFGGGGYFSHQHGSSTSAPHQSSMHPPLQPSSAPRAPSTRENRRRPEPLTHVQLPPLVTSAPTTPIGGVFMDVHGSHSSHTSSQHHVTTPGMTSTPRSQGHSISRRGSGGDRGDDTDEESNRNKRRRLNIDEIIEQN
jgi:hypothetical protein